MNSVHFDSARGKFYARIQVNKRFKWLGRFPKMEDALAAVTAAKKEVAERKKLSRIARAEERFWPKVKIVEGACWFWQAHIHKSGYGLFFFERDNEGSHPIVAHRFSFLVRRGLIPPGMTVDHLCHNRDAHCPGGQQCLHRRCVNPKHLQLATRGENVRNGTVHRKNQNGKADP